jgi:hypothetical protein
LFIVGKSLPQPAFDRPRKSKAHAGTFHFPFRQPVLICGVPETSAKTSPMLQTLFWGWDAPVVEKAVEHLMAGWDEKAALDLSETFILVPNAEAARISSMNKQASCTASRGTPGIFAQDSSRYTTAPISRQPGEVAIERWRMPRIRRQAEWHPVPYRERFPRALKNGLLNFAVIA